MENKDFRNMNHIGMLTCFHRFSRRWQLSSMNFGREEKMSEKNLDARGRWRSLTIGFRVSPEENEDINRRVRLSGLTKQEYITRRCQERSVVIQGNPRVHKALKDEMERLRREVEELLRRSAGDRDVVDRFRMVEEIYEGMGKTC